MGWLIGVVIQMVNPGVTEAIQSGDTSAVYNYTVPMLVFSSLGVAAIFLGFLLRREDKRKNYGLELPNKRT